MERIERVPQPSSSSREAEKRRAAVLAPRRIAKRAQEEEPAYPGMAASRALAALASSATPQR
jgi:hypothetical protein